MTKTKKEVIVNKAI